MKIAFVVNRFPTVVQTPILNMITGLIDLGHNVDIFFCSRGDSKIMQSDVQDYGLLENAIHLHSFPAFLKAVINSPGLIRMRSYDIIHCQTGLAGLKFLLFHRLRIFRGKLVIQFRGDDLTGYVKQNGDKVYMNLFKEADCFLVVCSYLRKIAIELGCPKEKIKVVRSGIDLGHFRLRVRENPVKNKARIVFVGRLVEKKGVEYAIRAISILKKKGRNLELLIIGDGPLRNNLKNLSRNLGLEKNIIFLGTRNHNYIVKVLNRAHLFVAPSVTAKSGNQEGIPNVLKEAMATGLPVVSTYHAGIPELVEDGVSGFLVPERDPQALAERLGYLIDNPDLWSKMGRNGRKFVEENYDKEKLNKELVSIYKSLIG